MFLLKWLNVNCLSLRLTLMCCNIKWFTVIYDYPRKIKARLCLKHLLQTISRALLLPIRPKLHCFYSLSSWRRLFQSKSKESKSCSFSTSIELWQSLANGKHTGNPKRRFSPFSWMASLFVTVCLYRWYIKSFALKTWLQWFNDTNSEAILLMVQTTANQSRYI